MTPDPESPFGMLRDKIQAATALAVAQEKLAQDHEAQAAQCREIATGLRAKAKAFEEAADAVKRADDHKLRKASL